MALAASLLGGAREVSACQPPPGGWLPKAFTPAPANGVVVVTFGCHADCEEPPPVGSLTLKDAAGNVVPGGVVFSQARGSELVIAFRPEPGALTEAQVYSAELSGAPPLDGILIAPAVTWNEALTPTENVFESDQPVGETVCCKGPLDTCGNAPCFRSEVDRRTIVTIGWEAPAASLEHYQYVFRLGREQIDPTTPWSWSYGSSGWLAFPATEASYCYVLELKRLMDGAVQTFAPRCVERPASFTPGLHPTPDNAVAQVLAYCPDPPSGYEEAWCEARAETCQTSPDELWCSSLATRCAMIPAGAAGGPMSGGGSGLPTSGGAPGGPSSGGASMDDGAIGGGLAPGAAGAGEDGETGERQSALSKGCGCSVPGKRSHGMLASFVLLLAAVVLARRQPARWRARRTCAER